tara:strand:+ start:9280 stop:9873 length:594 start_codon:yes stop_codon:yes gene_type:complete
LLVRNHYERVLSNYYGFIVGGPDTAGGNDTPEMEKIYGSRGSFEDFVNNLESLMNRDILSNASEHYAPYTKLHDIAGIPISFLMDNFLVSTWSTRRYSELFDYLGQNGLKFDKNKLAIRAVGIVPTVYADPRVVVQHSYRDDPHLIDFLEWRGIEEKYPYQLMYTPKMISKIKAYYHCDTALDAKLCEFRSELSGFN